MVDIDKEKIRKALDHFENDEYMDAKDIIKGEIGKKRDAFLKNKLDLKNDINPADDDKAGGEGDDE